LNKNAQKEWIFKGGTCLRKCYFKDYRFSEDLDFTIKNTLSVNELKSILAAINQDIQTNLGIHFDLKEPVVEIIEDDYGKESLRQECIIVVHWSSEDRRLQYGFI